ncbi:hypothetical protein TELCIR_18583 [Teladorsagia circumcincta]|uniref:Uncharacterized protein n=1 Tax=Teladorsagia circumcincta TaxID=45464 RepID=A0A2G9TPW9_TELCI|nr:hypothetical protein TELCIR_18583 [Teladorsagia circumcincta]
MIRLPFYTAIIVALSCCCAAAKGGNETVAVYVTSFSKWNAARANVYETAYARAIRPLLSQFGTVEKILSENMSGKFGIKFTLQTNATCNAVKTALTTFKQENNYIKSINVQC